VNYIWRSLATFGSRLLQYSFDFLKKKTTKPTFFYISHKSFDMHLKFLFIFSNDHISLKCFVSYFTLGNLPIFQISVDIARKLRHVKEKWHMNSNNPNNKMKKKKSSSINEVLI